MKVNPTELELFFKLGLAAYTFIFGYLIFVWIGYLRSK